MKLLVLSLLCAVFFSNNLQAGTVEIGPHQGPPGPPYAVGDGNFLQVTRVTYSYKGSADFTPGNAGAPLLGAGTNSTTGAGAFSNSTLFNPTSGEYIGSDANRPRLAVGDTMVIKNVTIDINGASPGGDFILRAAPLAATVRNFNYPLNVAWTEISGIMASQLGNRTNIALQNGASGPHTQNPAWIAAAESVLASADVNSMLAHDTGGSLNAFDYDVRFTNPLGVDDFILVAERNGNTFFELTPLDAAGNVIAGANTLRFGFPTGGAHTVYDYRTGVIAAGDAGIGNGAGGQDHAFSVTATSLFFDTTFGATAPAQNVFGFRVNNDGQADVNFFGLEPIPEADSILLSILVVVGIGIMILRRRSKAASCVG